ncbi:Glycosyl-hydrolase 97 C-terminal, oligomerisation [Pedobacter westerhofensis]|uniref:Glycosyl-hydrolase 97 C-terminal, oligomerisation n=1 Tax=Pedobacter westerhofensis TaxID=425512 RepID=A0A521FCG1_9SPHI|nr:glycoside hydrolase family 97 protein [Pedobacter westerhofensis]SMO93724.1 Glycosyl-hydrolase 97 C-terminal, oligomerisation [Pedobacter westerhofensis]
MIKKMLVIFVLLGPLFEKAAAQVVFDSPDGKLAVKVFSDKGKFFYEISRNKKPVVLPSLLGLSTSKGDFYESMKISTHTEIKGQKIQYTLYSGKKSDISSVQNTGVVQLVNKQQQPLVITFRISNDAVAFKYDLLGKASETITINEEKTEYKLPVNTLSWLQPMQEAKSGWEKSNPAYEEHYRQEVMIKDIPDSVNRGWVYPALLKTGENWLAITEAGIDGTYCATRLIAHPTESKFSVGFPDPREIFTGRGYLPTGKMPFSTPWRVIALGSLKTIMESTAGTDFSAKAAIANTGFIKPGKASWSWIMSKDDYIVYDEQKKYIDFAADMHWEYCLIDADWDRKIGYEKIKELADYAKSKNVGVLLWYNSAGDWNTVKYTPKNLLLTQESRRKEFSRIHEMGIKGVKIDFFGGDGQSVMQYYIDILQDAAKYELMVNFHGATLPRGWARTYPHLMTTEAVRGFENVSFQQAEADREAEICATVPFARNLFDPMDYTPMNLYKINNKIKRKTSSAFELALSVLFVSGIQHYAESAEGMAHVPENVQQFLRVLPARWDDVKFIDGYPGKYLVLARRSGSKWYIAGINSESAEKSVTFNTLPFGKKATLIANGDGQLDFRKETGKTSNAQKIMMPPQGGFVIVIE